MDSFVRKQKPHPRPVASSPPLTLTEAPRAIVRPDIVSSLDVTRLSASQGASPSASQPNVASDALSSTSKPRKRFRKKVSGLFGDQTDLKKRMSKLLLGAHGTDNIASIKSPDLPTSTRPAAKDMPKRAIGISGADSIVARLEEATAVRDLQPQVPDEFDLPDFVATASRTLGSPEKLQTVRKTMGRLSPRSNERFLRELDLGIPPKVRERSTGRAPITPPELPSVDSFELDSEREWLSSPVSVERTGAPAILRRKARRLDRGYRSVDVLKARLGAEYPRTKKRVESLDVEMEEIRGRAKKGAKRERSRVSDHDDIETDSDEQITLRQSSIEQRDRALTAKDPFQMLVEVAAVEQKNATPAAVFEDVPTARHGVKRKVREDCQVRESTTSEEGRDSKRKRKHEDVISQ